MDKEKVEEIRKYMQTIVEGLVDNRQEVAVTVATGEFTVVYNVSVFKGDLGKVIGREGKIAKALRTILLSVSVKAGLRAVMEIVE